MGEGEISDGEAKIYSWEKESNSRFSEYKRGRFPTEGTLNIAVSLGPWRMGCPRVDLFTNSMDRRLPVYFVPHQDPLALGVDAMLQSWEDLDVYAFPPFAMIRKVLNKLRDKELSYDTSGSSVAAKGTVPRFGAVNSRGTKDMALQKRPDHSACK